MKARRIIKVSVLSLTLLSMVVVAPMVGARSDKADEAQAKVKASAEERKVQLCEAKQTRIKTQLSRLGTKGESQLAVFDKISTKVQEFYTAKGYTVANYDTLVSAVTEARTVASKKVTEAAVPPEFDCTKSDPKAGVNAYKTAVKARSAALKEYKEAVHDLLLAVKNSQRQNETKTNTGTETDQEDATTETEAPESEAPEVNNDGGAN